LQLLELQDTRNFSVDMRNKLFPGKSKLKSSQKSSSQSTIRRPPLKFSKISGLCQFVAIIKSHKYIVYSFFRANVIGFFIFKSFTHLHFSLFILKNIKTLRKYVFIFINFIWCNKMCAHVSKCKHYTCWNYCRNWGTEGWRWMAEEVNSCMICFIYCNVPNLVHCV
jgi:hypothetical protein